MIDEKKLIAETRAAIDDGRYTGYVPEAVLFEVYGMIRDMPKVGEWIPVSEKLPRRGMDVEVTVDDGERYIAYWSCGAWFDSIDGDHLEVEAWKEPSEPWKGEEE